MESLERRVLLTGAHEQALLNAIAGALQPNSATGLVAFNSELTSTSALGTPLPVVGSGLSNLNPGTAIGGLLGRLGTATYTSVSSLVTALENGAGVTVTSSGDLTDNVELGVVFTTTQTLDVPLSANYGVNLYDPATLVMPTTLTESLSLGAYWDAQTSSAVFYVQADSSTVQVSSSVAGVTTGVAPTLADAGFETPVVGRGSYAYNPPGSGWVFTSGTGTANAGIAGNGGGAAANDPSAPEGSQVAFIQGDSSAAQQFTITAAQAGNYAVSFSAAQSIGAYAGPGGSTLYAPDAASFDVLLDGVTVATVTPGSSYAAYSSRSLTLTAGTHTLTFKGLATGKNQAGNPNTALLDNVSMALVPGPQLGFIQGSGGVTAASFSPTVTVSLNDQPPVDVAEGSGRLTMGQLLATPLSTLVDTTVTSAAPATVTVAVITSLAPGANPIVFTWPDPSAPSDVTSTLATDPTLAELNALRSVNPSAISSGLDEATGDLAAETQNTPIHQTNPFQQILPLIGESVDDLVSFQITNGTDASYSVLQQYLTNYTDSVSSASGTAAEPFASDQQLISLIQGIPGATVSAVTESAAGTRVTFGIDIQVSVPVAAPISFPGLNVSPALNFTYNDFPVLYPKVNVTLAMSFGVDASTGSFFVVAGTTPQLQASVTASATVTATPDLGALAVKVTGGTIQLGATASVLFVDPQTDNPATPGILTANELLAGMQPSGTSLPVPATSSLTGTASVNLPLSVYDEGDPVFDELNIAPATVNISWANVSQTGAYTFNTTSLGTYLGYNGLTAANLSAALTQIEGVLNDLAGTYAFGRDIPLLGTGLGTGADLGGVLSAHVGSFDDLQGLISNLQNGIGGGFVSLTPTSDGLALGLQLSDKFAGNFPYSVQDGVAASNVGGTASEDATAMASGTFVGTATYAGSITLGIVLTPTPAAGSQFYVPGGTTFSGTILANDIATGSTLTYGGTAIPFDKVQTQLLGGNFANGVPDTFSLTMGAGHPRIPLGTLVATPSIYFGSETFTGGSDLIFYDGDAPGANNGAVMQFVWSNAAAPSTLRSEGYNFTLNSGATTYSDGTFLAGIGTLITNVATWSTTPALATELPLVGETIDGVLPFVGDLQKVLSQIQSIGGVGPTTLNTDILAAAQTAGFSTQEASITGGLTGSQSNSWSYTLSFSITANNDVAFKLGAGYDSLLSLTKTYVHVTTTFAGSLTFGYDPVVGFFVQGAGDGDAPQFNITTTVPSQVLADKTAGTFGLMQLGTTGATVGMTASYTVSLASPGDDAGYGEPANLVSVTDLAVAGVNLVQSTVTGSGSIYMPFGAYIGQGGPGVRSVFSASWDPTRLQPLEFGATDPSDPANSTDPAAGLGDIYFDLGEFVTDMVGPYLQSIEKYNPMPQQLIDALNYEIPVIDETPLQLLSDYVGAGSDVATMLQIVSLVGELPTGTSQLDLSQYIAGAPATGDQGALDGGADGTESNIQGFVDALQNDDVTLPVLDDPHTAIAQTLVGEPTTLIEFKPGNDGNINLTDTITLAKVTVPLASLGVLSASAFFSASFSATLFGNIDIGLTTRGLLGQGIGSKGVPNLVDGFFIGDSAANQMGLRFEGEVTIGGEIDLFGVLSLASLSGSLGPEGTLGVRVNDVYYNSAGLPAGIAGYNGAPAGDGKAYVDELDWIASNYGGLCAVMPNASIGLHLSLDATVGDPPIGFSFNIYSHDFVIANFDIPCVPKSQTLAVVQGNQLVILPNVLGTGSGENTINTSVLYSTTGATATPIGIEINESNQDDSYTQTFTFSDLAGVNTLVINGTSGDDTFTVDPGVTLLPQSAIQYIQVEASAGNDTANFNDMTLKTASQSSGNSDLLGLTILGGNGNDYFQGNYSPDLIELGSGNNFAYVGTADGEVIESSGHDSITGGDGNDTVLGGTGAATITLGQGNNVIREGTGQATITVGNGQNLITSSTTSYSAGITTAGSTYSAGSPVPPEGSQAAFIDGNASISQTVNYFAGGGTQYSFSFEAAQRGTGNNGGEDIQVLIDGQVVDTVTPTATWQTYTTAQFTVAMSGSHVLTFQGLDTAGGDNVALIDNIKLASYSGYYSTANPVPVVYDPGFESPALAAGSYVNDDVVPDPSLQSASGFNATVVAGAWTYFAGMGIDTIQAGDGNNTIHGDLGGSAIQVGAGQNIIYGQGPGIDSITAGGGNDIVDLQVGTSVYTGTNVGTFSVDGGGGRTTLEIQGNANMILANGLVTFGTAANPTGQVQFSDVSALSLAGQGAPLSFDVSAWTGLPVAIAGGGGSATIVSTDNDNFTLTDTSLSRSDGASFGLNGIRTADLTGGASDNTFDVTGWHGNGTLTGGGGNDTIIAANLTAATLTNSALQRSGTGNLSLTGIDQAVLTGVVTGNANVNATGFSGTTSLFGEANANTLLGGTGSDYIVGGPGTGNDLVANGTVSNELVGGAGAGDTLVGGPGQDVLVGSSGGGDTITTGTGPAHVYTGGNADTVNAQTGSAIVYSNSSSDAVRTGASTTDRVVRPGDPGTVPSDFVPPSTTDLWEFPSLPTLAGATLPTGVVAPGQWVEYGTSASAGGVSDSTGTALEPSVIATGSGATAAQYVAWIDDRNGVYQVYVARETGGTWSELAGSAHGGGISNGTANASNPSIALDAAGYPVVAWSAAGNIEVAEYSPTANSGTGGWVALGTSLSSAGISATGNATAPQIVNTTAGPVVAWLDASTGATNVYARAFNGTSWAPVGSASGQGVTQSSASLKSFSLATDGNNLALAWAQPGTSANGSIYVLENAGAGWTAAGTGSAAGNGSASGNGISGTNASLTPSLAFAGGSLYAAWAANTDGTNNIVAAVYSGSAWQSLTIDTPASAGVNQVSRGTASNPVLSANGTSLDLAWVEDRLPATPDQAVALYVNRLVNGAFQAQLPGDSSFDGILGRPTSLSSPTSLAIAVDAAGNPYVAWGDASSGSSQVYLLGDTLTAAKIIYVNDASGPNDTYTTSPGGTNNSGLTPSSPLATIQAALTLAAGLSNVVILVDSGTYAGFTLTSADSGVTIIGSPGGITTITGAVNISGASGVSLRFLDASGGVNITGATNVSLQQVTAGAAADLAKSHGGSVTVTGSANVTLDEDAFTGLTFSGASSTALTVENTQLLGTGLTLYGPVTGLAATNDELASLTVAAASQGAVTDNDISGGGVTINAAFTGQISGNRIHNAPTGVTLNATAPLNGNEIFKNKTGVLVTAAATLGMTAGSTPNDIVDNGTGVRLLGSMQGQFIGGNDTGVTGSGTLGGTSLALANQIDGNTYGVNFQGAVQYNRIDANGSSIVVKSGQLIAHNLIYDNTGVNLETLGASNVEIVNDTFYSTDDTNILVDDGSTDVEVLDDVLWTGGGYDLDVATDSRVGFFSDYNDLFTTGTGQIVHYLVDFKDILDWQVDLALDDLHSIGTTVVNPTAAEPQFANLGFSDLYVLPAAAGIRSTSPTVGTGDPELDLALPASQYADLLANPSFESGVSGWTVNSGGTTQSGSPAAFDGASYFYPGAVASGFAQQTVSLTASGYTAAQIDAGTLDLSFGGRIRSSASDSPVDQGEIVLTFLDASGNAIGTPTVLSALNTTDRWQLVGDRVHVPAGARSVTYRFQATRESGTTDDSYLDAAFVYVVPNTVATDIGAYGASPQSTAQPVDEKIQLQTPDLYVNWTLTQSHQIVWSTFGNTGDSPVRIDLYQQTANGLVFVTTITPSTADTGSFAWIPQASGLTYGTYGLHVKLSLVGDPAVSDISTENFTIPANSTTFYVNDGSQSGDSYTTAPGNNRATGESPSDPLPLLTTLFDEYALGSEDTVYVDAGSYQDFAPLEISGNPALGSGQGVKIIGPTSGGPATISALGFTSPAVIDVNDADYVTLENLTLSGGNYGLWVRNASSNFTASGLSLTDNLLGGLRIESDSSPSDVLTNITASGNTGDGIYIGGAFVKLTGSASSSNTGDGFDLANAGGAILTNDVAYGNATGMYVANSTSGTTTQVGNPNLSLGLGDSFYNNANDGIYANGYVAVDGSIAYGQTANGDAGIDVEGGATATDDIAYGNYDGIRATNQGTSVTYDLAYANSDIGIEDEGVSTVTGNVSYDNGIGIRLILAPNTGQGPFVKNNLVYGNATQGIWITGANAAQIYNNTVYQTAGDALLIDAFSGLASSGIQIENNIFWVTAGYDISIDPTSEVGFKSDYNDLCATGSGSIGFWENAARATLASWQTATNGDADSISTDPLFVSPSTGDFHERSLSGSFHGGSLAPVIGGGGFPVAAPGALTADANESPAIDRGDPTFTYSNETAPNGGFINLGAFGNTPQASVSPASYVLVLKPAAGATLLEGQTFTITWRSQDTTGTVNIDLLQGSTVTPIAAGVPNSGTYLWSIPSTLTPEGAYTIRVTREGTGPAIGYSAAFTLGAPVTSFYVSPTGSDSNSGLDPADPKATIQALLAQYQLGAGDTIYVAAGTYNLTSNIVLTSANNGLTIDGVPGGASILYRSNLATGSYDIDIQAAANITLENLTLTGGYYAVNAGYTTAADTGLTFQGNNFQGSEEAGLFIANNYTTTTGQSQDVITGNAFHDMLSSDASNYYYGFGLEDTGEQISVTGNTFYNLGQGIYIANGAGSTVSGNTVYSTNIGIDTTNANVSANVVYDALSTGFEFAGTGYTLSGNTTYGDASNGISLSSGLATGNISYNNGNGLQFYGDATASDNLIYGNKTAGINGMNGSNILGNVIYGNGWGMQLSSYSSAADGGPVVENNLIYGNSLGGITISGGDTTPILNNTIYQTSGDALDIASANTNNLIVRDNIFWVTSGQDITVGSLAQGYVTIDYNDLCVTGSGQIGTWGTTEYATLGQWQIGSGMDADSISTDPLFVSAATGDFHVQSIYGSDHGATLAPILNPATGLPQPNPGTWTDDPNQSPTIDRGAPGDSYANEPLPNGGYVNLGAYGNSAQASVSPAHYLIVTNPLVGQTAAAGQPLTIRWRDELTNTGGGAANTDTIELVQGNTVVETLTAPDTGSYVWTPPGTLPSGTYQIEIIRTDATHISALSPSFSLQGFTGIYYVNGSSAGGTFTTAAGNDANSGLDPAHPKATIGAILADYTLQPGNIIEVDSGTYALSNNLVFTAADSGITIEGVPGGSTILNRLNTSSSTSYDIDLQEVAGITIKNFTFTGGYYGLNATYNTGYSTGIIVQSNTFVGSEEAGINLANNYTTTTLNSGDLISGNLFHDMLSSDSSRNYYGFGLEDTGVTITLSNNTFYNLGQGIYIQNGAGSSVTGNTVSLTNDGIDTANANVSNNTSFSNSIGFNFSGTGYALSGNTAYADTSEGLLVNSGLATANTAYSDGQGIYINGGATVSGNTVYNSATYGIDATTSNDFVYGNDVYSNGSWGIYGSPGAVSNNLVYANASGGIYLSGAYDASVLGNTVYQTTGPAFRLDGQAQNGYNPASIVIDDNVLWTTSGPDLLIDDTGEQSFTTPTSNYNDLYATGTGEIAQVSGANFATLASFSQELGLDTHSISADPQFISAAGPDGILGYAGGVNHGADDDFHVLPSSPTIDAGDPSVDFLAEPGPNGGRINLGYDGDTAQAATSASSSTLQVVAPGGTQKLQAGRPTTITWLSSGLLANQTITEVGVGEGAAVGEYHPAEFNVGSQSTTSNVTTINTSLVANPAPQSIYQTFAYAPSGVGNTLAYQIPAANGTYTLRLDFSEPYYNSVGTRTFDILLNGQVVQPAFDIYAAAKSLNKAVALTFTVTASGGNGISLVLRNDTATPALLNGFELSTPNPTGTASPTANVQVSYDAGATWSTIATNQPFDAEGRGSYVWTPTTSSPAALVRVVSGTTSGVSSPVLVAPSGNIFYVNGTLSGSDVYTTASGNNANDGKTPATPMASIEAVLNDYQPGPGDIIEVDAGTYTLFHDVNIPAADSGVTITGPASSSAAPAIVNRNNFSANDYVFNLLGYADNVTIEHLSITGGYSGIEAPNANGQPNSGITIAYDQIYGNDGSGYSGGIQSASTSNWTVTGNTVHDNTGFYGGIYFQASTAVISNNTVYNEGHYAIFLSNANGASPSQEVVSGNTVYGSADGIYADGALVEDNFAHDNTSVGIYDDGYGVVTGNTVWRQTTSGADGIEISNATASDNVVFDNYIGIYLNGGSASIYGNRVYDNLDDGLSLNGATGQNYTIGYNYVATVYDNLIYANAQTGIYLGGTYYQGSSLDLTILNNTVYQLVGDAIDIGAASSSYPTLIQNNILWVQAGYDIDVASAAQAGIVSNYNVLYHLGGNANVGLWNGTPQATLAAWQSASGLDAHSTEANPNFVDPSGADAILGYSASANGGAGANGGADDNFFVNAGSPAIGTGSPASYEQPTTDALGYTFHNDIGAYAYRGASVQSTPATVLSATLQPAQITVVFSQAPNDIDAAAPSLYVLRGAGPDGIFGTSDDVVYTLTPSYAAGSTTVTLAINAGVLRAGLYQLTILSNANASVHNLAGLALDGDHNGTPGGNYVTNFTVTPATPTLTWATPTPITYGTLLSATQLDATASVPGTFTYTPALGTLLAAGTQTLSVLFTPTDNIDYTTVSATVQLTVNRATPTLNWLTPNPITYGTTLSAAQLDASANTYGTFDYSPTFGALLGAGPQSLSVTFIPNDTLDYNDANATVTLTVNRATPTLTWANPSDIPYGTLLGNAQLNATANTLGSFLYGPPAGTLLSIGNAQTLSVTFSPFDSADYTTATATASINVLGATQLAFSTQPVGAGAGAALPTLDVTLEDKYGDVVTGDNLPIFLSIASGPGGFTPLSTTMANSVNGVAAFSNVAITAPGTYTLAAADPIDALSGFASQPFTITKAAATVTLPPAPLDLTYDATTDADAWATPTLSGPNGVTAPTGTATLLFYNGPTATGLPLSAPPINSGVYTVVANYPGDANYAPATSAPETFTINQAAVSVTLPPAPQQISYDGTSDVTSWVQAALTGTGGAPAPTGGIAYSYYAGYAASGTPLPASPINPGTYTVIANYAGNSNYLPTQSNAVTFTILPAASSLTAFFQVNDGSAQRSMVTSLTVSFNAAVTLQPNAITLADATGNPIPFTLTEVNDFTYTLTFTDPQFIGGSLANGRYVLSVLSSLVSSTGGQTLPSNQTFAFFRLFGDALGTGTVTNKDYALFRTAYRGGAPDYVPYFDFDSNGVIDSFDYNQFEADLGTSI